MKRVHLKKLEAEVERLRKELMHKVSGDYTKLADPAILPLSKQLDGLITEYMKETTMMLKK
ncbi:aspartyl-phosphate phosphatase Spo0E family protein [Numidum massiliense]|uniref:aspartyl-phosphate phosphatase Spo0E family protein n=1 Tax=Numidum massiliense TaxID=1522315 RepID=UPI0006D54EA6|nr:aspartyl-phosphate phosphatase Spo0E family protein [Numidum massiliense]